MSADSVRFNKGWIVVLGILGGVGIALGLPLIVLVYGEGLGAGVQTLVTLAALVFGAMITCMAAFFGLVIPSFVETGHGGKSPKKGRKYFHASSRNGESVEISGVGVKVVDGDEVVEVGFDGVRVEEKRRKADAQPEEEADEEEENAKQD